MKKGLRITLVAAAFCLLGLICLVIHGMNERRIGQLTCAGVKVEFTDDFNFVTAKDVEGYLNKATAPTYDNGSTAWICGRLRAFWTARVPS